MNCDNCKAEIEELTDAQTFSSSGFEHLSQCVNCRSFRAERARLRQLTNALSPVTAPPDFNFRLKSRLRQTERRATSPLLPSAWQKTVWLSAAGVLCLLVFLTFGLTRVSFISPQPEAVISNQPNTPPISVPNVALNVVPTPSNAVVTVSQSQQNNDPVRELAKRNARLNIKRETMLTEQPKIRRIVTKNEEVIASRDSPNGVKDSTLSAAPPSLMPRGIPNPLEPPQKQAGKDLLLTIGIGTESEDKGLKVISLKAEGQAAQSGLQIGDLIEKVNGENPAAVSGDGFSEIILTLRRLGKAQQIKILLKP